LRRRLAVRHPHIAADVVHRQAALSRQLRDLVAHAGHDEGTGAGDRIGAETRKLIAPVARAGLGPALLLDQRTCDGARAVLARDSPGACRKWSWWSRRQCVRSTARTVDDRARLRMIASSPTISPSPSSLRMPSPELPAASSSTRARPDRITKRESAGSLSWMIEWPAGKTSSDARAAKSSLC